jgi:hypothetical protein
LLSFVLSFLSTNLTAGYMRRKKKKKPRWKHFARVIEDDILCVTETIGKRCNQDKIYK